jgi:biotin transporter BioY
MVKHGFILGWVFAWFLIGFWRLYIEKQVNMWWSVAFFVGGLFLGTIVQTLMDRAEEKGKSKEIKKKISDEPKETHKY